MWHPTEALITHVTTRFQHQGRLLEEAERDLAETRRDLDVYKKAFSIAERDKRDLEERFERERQTLSDEIRQLKERDAHGGGFEQEKQALNDGIHQLKVRLPSIQFEVVGHFGYLRQKPVLVGHGDADSCLPAVQPGNRDPRKTSGVSAKPPTGVRRYSTSRKGTRRYQSRLG